MNFLFVGGGFQVWGLEIVLEGLMRRLSEMGHRTMALISGWNNGEYPDRLSTSGLAFQEVRLGRFYRSRPMWTLDTLRNLPGAALQVRKIATCFCPDIAVYLDPQLLLMGSIILPQLRNVLYVHEKPGKLMKTHTAAYIISRAEIIVCVSNYIAQCVGESTAARSNIAVVPNGLNLPTFCGPKTRSTTVRLGIVGRVACSKQHKLLIEALDLVRRRLPKVVFSLRIFGNRQDDEYVNEVRAAVKRLNLQSMVEWSGFEHSRDQIYEDLDIVAAPAIDEPFGLSVVEAGAYGLPVVASHSGAFSETVIDGMTGLLFPPGDVESLAGAVQMLILDGSLRTRLGRAAREHVASKFSEQRMATMFVRAVIGRGISKR
jgi:glycosyltransferase involved in cell wall biosynthesis